MESGRWEERVRHLERRQRRLWASSVVAWTFIGTACLSGAVASDAKEVRAEAFVLVGPDGKERGSLAVSGEGAALALVDGDTKGAVLSAEQGSASLEILDPDGNRIVMLGASDGNDSSLVPAGNPMLAL